MSNSDGLITPGVNCKPLVGIAAATLVLVALTTDVRAQAGDDRIQRYVSANTLHEWCQAAPDKALYYVAGVVDALTLNADHMPVCIPVESTLTQIRDVVCKYLRENPAKRHYNTASSLWLAQSQAFPCAK